MDRLEKARLRLLTIIGGERDKWPSEVVMALQDVADDMHAATPMTQPTEEDVEAVARAIEGNVREQCAEQNGFFVPMARDDPTAIINGEIDLISIARAAIAAMPDRPSNEAVASPLIEFFRGPGYERFGHQGDCEGWSTEQTAVHFLTEYLNAGPKEWPLARPSNKPVDEKAAEEAVTRALDGPYLPQDEMSPSNEDRLREALKTAVSALEGVVRLSTMGLEESLMEPEEYGNFVAYRQAKEAIVFATTALKSSEGDG